ncbi:hypothetical protein [Streptomyces sp. NPDC086766]|uniref:hypothetical protein n=1 Tax=Streptomyces sp. NPDC086766 TaxID=3365754 RepID=UPI0037FC35C6
MTDPVSRTILLLDIEKYSDRDDVEQAYLRRVLYDIADRALEHAGIDETLRSRADRGDSVMELIDANASVPALLRALLTEVPAQLHGYNRLASSTAQIRLRGVVATGYVAVDAHGGWVGSDLNHACRLLDAPLLRAALRERADGFALCVSEGVHLGIVRHDHAGVRAAAFHPVTLTGKNGPMRAWLHGPVPRDGDGHGGTGAGEAPVPGPSGDGPAPGQRGVPAAAAPRPEDGTGTVGAVPAGGGAVPAGGGGGAGGAGAGGGAGADGSTATAGARTVGASADAARPVGAGGGAGAAGAEAPPRGGGAVTAGGGAAGTASSAAPAQAGAAEAAGTAAPAASEAAPAQSVSGGVVFNFGSGSPRFGGSLVGGDQHGVSGGQVTGDVHLGGTTGEGP